MRPTRGLTRMLAAAAVAAGALALTAAGPAAASPAPRTAPPLYQLTLGDSLAAGTGASTPSLDYAALTATDEAAAHPGLTLENLACGGATVQSMMNGPGCSYSTGTQLGDALAFLAAHPGQVAYVTIDIGANNVDGCITGSSISVTCVTNGLTLVETDLPLIVADLQAAAPGVPIFGMDYYDPFLQQWILGTAAGESNATLSASLSAVFNGILTDIYAAAHAVPVDVQGAFQVQDTAMTRTWNSMREPQNVANTCNWTHMCDPVSGGGYAMNIHANDTGHAIIATQFERAVDRWFREAADHRVYLVDAAGTVAAAGRGAPTQTWGSVTFPLTAPVVGMALTPDAKGYWLVAADGGVFAFGDAAYRGSLGATTLVAPITGITPTPDGKGYWLVDRDGHVYAFGDARYEGNLASAPGGTTVAGCACAPAVGLASTGSDAGYWTVTAASGPRVSGGTTVAFPSGDAAALGPDLGTLTAPAVGAAPTADGNGLWAVAADGGVFTLGSARFHGSAGDLHLNAPVVGLAPSITDGGYLLVAADGGVFAYGDAAFPGSGVGLLPAPVVGFAVN